MFINYIVNPGLNYIQIKGYETKTNTEITRISLTPIEPQPVEGRLSIVCILNWYREMMCFDFLSLLL